MNSTEKHIVRDHLSRHRRMLGAGFLVHLAVTGACWWAEVNFLAAVLMGIVFLRPGLARTLRSLPITTGQLAGSWRFVALVFPAGLFLTALLIGAAIAGLAGAPHFSIERLLVLAISQTLFLGLTFCLFTWVTRPPRIHATDRQKLSQGISAIAAIISFQSILSASWAVPSRFKDAGALHWSIAGLMLVATIVGWRRIESWISGRTAKPEPPLIVAEKPVSTPSAASWNRFGAVPYLAFCLGKAVLIMTLLIAVLFALAPLLPGNGPNDPAPMMELYAMASLPLASLGLVFYLLQQLRLWRTLPLRRSTIAHLLTLMPLAAVTVVALATQLLGAMLPGNAPADWLPFQVCMAGAVILSSAAPVCLRFGARSPLMMIFPVAAFLMLPGVDQLGPALAAHGVRWIPAALLFLGISWWATYRMLASGHPWKAGHLAWRGTERAA